MVLCIYADEELCPDKSLAQLS